jgi:hypothetical protein
MICRLDPPNRHGERITSWREGLELSRRNRSMASAVEVEILPPCWQRIATALKPPAWMSSEAEQLPLSPPLLQVAVGFSPLSEPPWPRRVQLPQSSAAPEEPPLIEEGFSDFASAAVPPPQWRNRRLHRRASSDAAKHQHAWPPKGERRPLFREELRTLFHSSHGSCH